MATRPLRYGAPDPEVLDDTPIEMPLNARMPRPLQDLIASMIRQEIETQGSEEFETIEEADDFEEDDPDTLDLSRYEFEDMKEEYWDPKESAAPASAERSDRPGSGEVSEQHPQTGDEPDQNAPEPE